MLCFVFSALAILLDQLFKHWTVMAVATGDDITLIPKIFGLTYLENTGAAFSFLADTNMRWPLAAVSFICCIFLIMILLRYDAGFWGRLGLAAVLGGAAGNMLDRVFRGFVVDMFEFQFINFAVFNVADCFITLGGIVFIIYFIAASVKEDRMADKNASPRVLPKTSPSTVRTISDAPAAKKQTLPEPPPFAKKPPVAQETTGADDSADVEDYSEYVKGLSETRILEEFDLDRLMSEYGIDEKNN